MASVATLIFTTGEPGAGKTYIRCARFLVDDFLVNSDGVHISNFPVYPDKVADSVVKRSNFFKKGILAKITAPFRRKQNKITKEEILKRIHVIPEDVLKSWRSEESGPWEYFNGCDLKHAHIAIDEIHNYLSVTSSEEHLKKWDEFLGEIRHRGCTIEGLTQDPSAVSPVFKNRAGLNLDLVPRLKLRDPIFKVPYADWYELVAGFTGIYRPCILQQEYGRVFGNKRKVNHTTYFYLDPEYFCFYNSYSASHAEKENGVVDDKNRSPEHEYQRRTKLGLIYWFVWGNFYNLISRILLFIFLMWLCFFGGLQKIINGMVEGMSGAVVKTSKTVTGKTSVSSAKDGVKTDKNDSAVSSQKEEIIYKNVVEYNDEKLLSENWYLVRAGDIRQTVSDIDVLNSQISEQKKQIEELKKENAKGYVPVYFSDSNKNEIILKNGLRIYENYEFTEGQYKGKKVKFISLKDRYYELDDDRIIRMHSIANQ